MDTSSKRPPDRAPLFTLDELIALVQLGRVASRGAPRAQRISDGRMLLVGELAEPELCEDIDPHLPRLVQLGLVTCSVEGMLAISTEGERWIREHTSPAIPAPAVPRAEHERRLIEDFLAWVSESQARSEQLRFSSVPAIRAELAERFSKRPNAERAPLFEEVHSIDLPITEPMIDATFPKGPPIVADLLLGFPLGAEIRRWEADAKEWQEIKDELLAAAAANGGTVTAYDVSVEQQRRALAQGRPAYIGPRHRLLCGTCDEDLAAPPLPVPCSCGNPDCRGHAPLAGMGAGVSRTANGPRPMFSTRATQPAPSPFIGPSEDMLRTAGDSLEWRRDGGKLFVAIGGGGAVGDLQGSADGDDPKARESAVRDLVGKCLVHLGAMVSRRDISDATIEGAIVWLLEGTRGRQS